MERISANQKQQVESVIEKFLLDESNTDMRILIKAVAMIDDENVLYRIVKETSCLAVGGKAVERISSDELLEKIALDSKVENLIRIVAVKQIKQQTVLKKLYEVGSVDIRKTAIALILDDKFLYDVVFSEKDSYISIAAIKQIGSQEMLYNIAVRHKNLSVQIAAAKQLVEQSYLIRVAKLVSLNASIRIEAIKKLDSTDLEGALYDISKNDTDINCRIEGIKRLREPSVLVDIALNDSSEEIQYTALSSIPAFSVFSEVNNRLMTIIDGIYSSRVKAVAVAKLMLNSNEFFVTLIRNNQDEEVRLAALSRIDDQNRLAEIAYYETTKYQYQSSVRMEALKKLKNHDVINMIALGDRDCRVRELAVERACSATLVNVAINDSETKVCITAVNKLENDYDLIEVLLHTKNKWVRNAVIQQLCSNK